MNTTFRQFAWKSACLSWHGPLWTVERVELVCALIGGAITYAYRENQEFAATVQHLMWQIPLVAFALTFAGAWVYAAYRQYRDMEATANDAIKDQGRRQCLDTWLHDVARNDAWQPAKVIRLTLWHARAKRDESGLFVCFEYQLFNGSVFTLSHIATLSTPPKINKLDSNEIVQLGHPRLGRELFVNLEHGGRKPVYIDVPIPNTSLSRLREIVNANNRGQFDLYPAVCLSLKVHEEHSGPSHFVIQVPSIDVTEAVERGLRDTLDYLFTQDIKGSPTPPHTGRPSATANQPPQQPSPE